MLRVCCSIPGLCGLALCLWLGAGPSAAAFETLNRIRAEGALRVAVLDGQPTADRMALEQLAEHLSVHLTPIIAEDHDALFKLLASGEVDLVGDPVSARRPLPQGLGLSRPVRHADLWLVRGASAGSPSTLAVRLSLIHI